MVVHQSTQAPHDAEYWCVIRAENALIEPGTRATASMLWKLARAAVPEQAQTRSITAKQEFVNTLKEVASNT